MLLTVAAQILYVIAAYWGCGGPCIISNKSKFQKFHYIINWLVKMWLIFKISKKVAEIRHRKGTIMNNYLCFSITVNSQTWNFWFCSTTLFIASKGKSSIAQHLGFSKGSPVAACIIYKWLRQWTSFEVYLHN